MKKLTTNKMHMQSCNHASQTIWVQYAVHLSIQLIIKLDPMCLNYPQKNHLITVKKSSIAIKAQLRLNLYCPVQMNIALGT